MIEPILFIGMLIVAMWGGYAIGYMDGGKNARRDVSERVSKAYDAGEENGLERGRREQ